MKMTPIERLKAHGLIDWSVLQFGMSSNRYGSTIFVTPNDVSDYAMEEIGSLPEDLVPICGELIGAESADADKIIVALGVLSQRFGQSLDIAKRKWRAVFLEALLEELGSDPVYDLLKMGEFWAEWGMGDKPYVVQGVDNNIEPGDYYTESNLLMAMDAHNKWLDAEILSLK
ncbi:MAG TPA: DUF2247 family protein [Moraxellaceae bacterium]|nr:DUF2247 family protein [Moraxellaceae bacterium]